MLGTQGWRRRAVSASLALLLVLPIAAACGPVTTPCGTFTYTGTPHSNRGITVNLDFVFAPVGCGAAGSPTAQSVAFVQIVRIMDQTTGGFLSPNSEQTNRRVSGQSNADLNGWAVDRLSGRVWGYYGRNDDGTFASTLTTGSSTSTATLRDVPGGWPNQSRFDAVSVPVCLTGNTACQDRLLGYYYWLFNVDSSGVVGTQLDQIGVDWHRDAVDQSVNAWNAAAAGLGKNSFPTLPRMP